LLTRSAAVAVKACRNRIYILRSVEYDEYPLYSILTMAIPDVEILAVRFCSQYVVTCYCIWQMAPTSIFIPFVR